MTVRSISVRLALVCTGVVTLAAQEPRRAPQFTFERPIVSTTGPQRLRPDVPLLTGSRARLADLRLYDSSGREVPYLLVRSAPPPDEWSSGRIAAIADTKTTSGFEVDFEGLTTIDRVRLEGIQAPFMKRALLEGSGDRSHWTVLLDQTTVFDLPDSELRRLELAFDRGAYRYLRVTWDDSNSAKVPPPTGVMARTVQREYGAAEPMTAPVVFERRPSEPGKSRYRIRLPGSRLPVVALELSVGGGYLLRRAVVTESRLIGGKVVPVAVGGTVLRKVVEGPLAATALRIPITLDSEPEIDLVVDDGDNPPMELSAVSIIFGELPWIYFESDGHGIVARYGDPALQAPRYDLEAARTSISTQIAGIVEARWGDPRAHAAPEIAPVVPAAMPTGGASIDVSLFRFSRTLPEGDAGLIAVPLDAAALAHSSGPHADFADVRVVDASGRQVPYVLEQRDEPLTVSLVLEQRSAPAQSVSLPQSGTTTYYRIRMPLARLPPARLVLSTSARVFDRTVSIAVERPADAQSRNAWQEQITTARWTHANRDTAAPALALSLSTIDVAELMVAVAEGDNSPLPLTSAQLLLPSYRLRLFRGERMPLRVVYGQARLSTPSYDLALLAPQVLGTPAREVSLSGEQGGESALSNPLIATLISPRVFWGVLIVAVMALLVLLASLLKRQPPAA